MEPRTDRPTPSGRFVRVAHTDGPYWAFVPSPLPPQVQYDDQLIGLLSRADRALGRLAGQAENIANPHLLIRPFMHREAVLSSRIEGTQTEIGDLYAFKAEQLPLFRGTEGPLEDEVREVYNYVLALEHGLSRLQDLPVSLRLIREVHERLLAGVRGQRRNPGEFRDGQNWIGPPECAVQEADFVFPPIDSLGPALNAFEHYLHGEDPHPPLVRLAAIHYQFEVIHPFGDGNGRIGRLLIILLLVHWGLLPVPVLYLSAYFQHNRGMYIRRLREVSEEGRWAEWIGFFLQGVAVEAADAARRAKRIQRLQAEWRERVTAPRVSALVLRLVDALFEAPILTIPMARDLLNVTYTSAQRSVERLIEAGILHQLGDARYAKTYVAREVLDLLSAPKAEEANST